MKIKYLKPFGLRIETDFAEICRNIKIIEKLVCKNLIVVFPDLKINETKLIKFGELFGECILAPPALKNKKNVILNKIWKISNKENLGHVPTENMWHQDQFFMQAPPHFSIFYCKQAPKKQGHTLFSNQIKAFQLLPHDVKEFITGKVAKFQQPQTKHLILKKKFLGKDSPDGAYHPLVLPHWKTRELSLCNFSQCIGILGVKAKDFKYIKSRLSKYYLQKSIIYKHQYSNNDLVIWDNFSLLHSAVKTSEKFTRLMWQIRIRKKN